MFLATATASIALAGLPAAAAAFPGPPGGPDAPPPACRSTKKLKCVRTDRGPAKTARPLQRTLVQRGLGVPTPKRLVGRKRACKLERKLRTRLAGGARASAADALGTAIRGSAGVRGARGRLRYQWRFDYDIPDACPNPGPPDATNGVVPVAGVGDLHLTSVENRGRHRIRTDVVAHLRTEGQILSSRHAALVTALPRSATPEVLTVRRTQTVLDTQTGDTTDSTVGADVTIYAYAANLKE